MSVYDDKALLFITSTDATIPHGRNVRAQHRVRTATKAAPAKGEFGTLDFRMTGETSDVHARKRQKRSKTPKERDDSEAVGSAPQMQHRLLDDQLMCSPTRPLNCDWTLPFVNPAEILAVATFHVRRQALASVRRQPEHLANILRRRQWSCMPYAYNCFGKDPCVDSAIVCVADRIRFLSGSPSSPLLTMKHYEKALKDLQDALNEPNQHNPQDMLVAVQLLAVYEMLDTLDNDTWSKHVAGAELMIQTYTTLTPEKVSKWDSRGCGHALPMFGDALIKGDVNFFRTYPWRDMLSNIFGNIIEPPPGIQDLMHCLRLMPALMLDVEAAMSGKDGIDMELRFGLLDRAHDIRHRVRSALCGNQLYTECNYRDLLSSYDLLGTFLSGLLGMDRIIASLKPKHLVAHRPEYGPTGELCTQLLHLELGASGHYPSSEVLAGFRHANMLDTVVVSYPNKEPV